MRDTFEIAEAVVGCALIAIFFGGMFVASVILILLRVMGVV